MEPRKLAAAIVAILNDGAEQIEKLIAADVGDKDADDDNGDDKKKRGTSTSTSRNSRSSRSTKAKDEDEDEDEDEDDEDEDEDAEASEADIVKAARGALKVLEKDDVVKIIKKHGKADKATEVKPALRAKVIEALEQAVADES